MICSQFKSLTVGTAESTCVPHARSFGATAANEHKLNSFLEGRYSKLILDYVMVLTNISVAQRLLVQLAREPIADFSAIFNILVSCLNILRSV